MRRRNPTTTYLVFSAGVPMLVACQGDPIPTEDGTGGSSSTTAVSATEPAVDSTGTGGPTTFAGTTAPADGTSGSTSESTESTESTGSTGAPDETCGDGRVEGDEECDEGPANGQPGGTCSEACVALGTLFEAPRTVELDLHGGSAYPHELEVTDLDGDGRLDLVTVDRDSSTVTTLYGFGDGRFWAPHRRLSGWFTEDVTLADLDGDGALDAITANSGDDTVTVFMGDATAFAAGTDYDVDPGGPLAEPGALAVADVTGDGHLDVVTANRVGATVSVLEGDGAGGLMALATLDVGGQGPADVDVADVDQDGVLDIVTCNATTNDLGLLAGQGGGAFAPATTFTTAAGSTGQGPVALRLTDLSGDGAPDAVVAAESSSEVVVLVAEPGGGFGAPVAFGTTVGGGGLAPRDLAVGDLDEDGVLDVVTCNNETHDLTVLVGAGGGVGFEAPVLHSTGALGPAVYQPNGIELRDMNGDGSLDAVTVDQQAHVSIVFNDGAGGLTVPTRFHTRTYFYPARAVAMAIDDLDGDGVLDVVVAHQTANDITTLPGLGEGRLAPAQRISLQNGTEPRGLAVGDLGSDGLPEMVTLLSTFDVFMRIQRRSTGRLDQFPGFFVQEGPQDVAMGDLDGDLDLDVVVVSGDFGELTSLRNDGGVFFESELHLSLHDSRAVELADMTGDGLLDAVSVSAFEDALIVHPGEGTGRFSMMSTFTTADAGRGRMPVRLAVADVTGDGRLDALTANADTGDISLLVNEGGGVMTLPSVLPAVVGASDAAPGDIAVGDFDGDGVLDVVTVNRGRDTVSVLLGLGGGGFADPDEAWVGHEPSAVAVGDFDGDGLDDVATANAGDDTITVLLSAGP